LSRCRKEAVRITTKNTKSTKNRKILKRQTTGMDGVH